jgi:indolepyruvate ferredoxin oxidoreductase
MLKAFGLLAPFKCLRGSVFDPFGYSQERRQERALIDGYRADIDLILAHLTPANRHTALSLARLPEQIRGYGHVKDKAVVAAEQEAQRLRQCLRDGAPAVVKLYEAAA